MPRYTRQNRPEVRRPTECNPRTGEERPHTNALERPRGPLYLSLRPTNARIWHKAVFKMGPVAGPKPTRVRQGQKYLRPRRHSPFWGASGARQSTPPEGGISLGGMAPWGRRNSPVPRHIRQNRPEIKRPTECNPTTGEEKSSAGTSVFIVASHQRTNRRQTVFKPSRRATPHASGKKNTFGPVGIPLFGAPQALGKTPPPEGGIPRGDGPLRPEEISSAEAHPAEPSRDKTAYRMQPNNWRGKKGPRGPLYLSLRPTNARIWHKAVFKVGHVAGPNPTRVRQGQKYLRPRRHSPFWGASGTRQ